MKSLGFPLTSAKGAKPATVHTDIGVIYVLVHHIGGAVPMPVPTKLVSKGADRVDVRAAKQVFAVIQTQPFAGLNLVKNGRES